MADWNIATGQEQPINRTGLDNVQETGEVQGMLVGVDTSGAEPKLVQADAGPSANEAGDAPITAVGVLLPREVMPDDLSNVNTHPWDDYEKQVYMEDRTLSGDRATVISYGIEMVNDGTEESFTPGEPVYLAEGGGLTQTEPGTSGAAVQCVGVALTPEDYGPGGGGPSGTDTGGRERVLLDVGYDYEVNA